MYMDIKEGEDDDARFRSSCSCDIPVFFKLTFRNEIEGGNLYNEAEASGHKSDASTENKLYLVD